MFPTIVQLPHTNYQNYHPTGRYDPRGNYNNDDEDDEEDEEEEDPFAGYRGYPPQYYQPNYPHPPARPAPQSHSQDTELRSPGIMMSRFSRDVVTQRRATANTAQTGQTGQTGQRSDAAADTEGEVEVIGEDQTGQTVQPPLYVPVG